MTLAKRYAAEQEEPALDLQWQAEGTYHFRPGDARPVYAIDTPPPTVSGNLHFGSVYSYSHADFMARYFRMRGWNVYYPMGFDDNGLPTERLVERRLKIHALQVGRQAFIQKCLDTAVEMEADYRSLFRRIGLSVDWRYTYRTIDAHAQRCSQHSFLELYHKGLAYRSQAPTIWCPECHTAYAQAELADLERATEFITLPFPAAEEAEAAGAGGAGALHIATTRPELLAACVCVFLHPQDPRAQEWAGRQVIVPLYGHSVPVLTDPGVDREKGTGAVMCCTFGDQADVAWWYSHKLPLIEAIDRGGRMLPAADIVAGAAGAGDLAAGAGVTLAGLAIEEARKQIKEILASRGLILDRQSTQGTIRVHERCDTPAEFVMTSQWFIRVLENKQTFLELGEQLKWHPAHMHARYKAWVEGLSWDWCISRQRYYGVPFPVWYCKACGETLLAEESELPVDPQAGPPSRPCRCGSTEFAPDTDIMDTWATSSVSPQIAAGWLEDPQRFAQLFPMTLRPQAFEIIRTWTFYTIVKSWYHFGRLPWSDVFISGWAVAGEGMGKISKSRGGGPPVMELINRYSADGVRYWAASTGAGRDAVISEEKMQMGAKLVTKLWNVARFAEPFIQGQPSELPAAETPPADRWIRAALHDLVRQVTAAFDQYEYGQAKTAIEGFFWRDLADNYLEMAKQRLYDPQAQGHAAACQTLRSVLLALLKLLAPLMPFVTERIWRELFAEGEGLASIHNSAWPEICPADPADLALGEHLIAIATAVRRYKSENALSLGSELGRLEIATADPALRQSLQAAMSDISSVTRAREVTVLSELSGDLLELPIQNSPIFSAIFSGDGH